MLQSRIIDNAFHLFLLVSTSIGCKNQRCYLTKSPEVATCNTYMKTVNTCTLDPAGFDEDTLVFNSSVSNLTPRISSMNLTLGLTRGNHLLNTVPQTSKRQCIRSDSPTQQMTPLRLISSK